jgi:VIT1/CCC1 family predicted Fe2+/Mn2+ transporter
MDRDQMRASESDRQVVMERLRQAVEEGRLDVGEYQDRVDAAMNARVYSELDALIYDLQQLPPPGFQEASMEPTQVMRPQPLSKVNQQLREEAEERPRKWKIAGVAVAIAAVACLVIFMLSPELFLYIAIGVLVVLVLFVVAAFSGLF